MPKIIVKFLAGSRRQAYQGSNSIVPACVASLKETSIVDHLLVFSVKFLVIYFSYLVIQVTSDRSDFKLGR